MAPLNCCIFDDLTAAVSSEIPMRYRGALPAASDVAALFLTSGLTGFSKIVAHTHQSLLAACQAKIGEYELGSRDTVLNWVGFDHVAGSIEMHLAPLLAGARQVHVSASSILSTELLFVELLDKHSVAIAFAPNFLLGRLVRELSTAPSAQWSFPHLRRINSGGEAVVTKTALDLQSAINRVARAPINCALAPGFGMTETCAGCIYGSVRDRWPSRTFLDLGSCVRGCEMRIVRADGVTPANDGESEELQVRGDMIFDHYYGNADATAQAFRKDPDGGLQWFATGDQGIIDAGILRLSGRIKETLLINGVSYSVWPLEVDVSQIPGVVSSTPVVTPYRQSDADSETFLEVVAQQPLAVVPLSTVQRGTLGKISRAHLVRDFDRGVFNDTLENAQQLARAAYETSYIAPAARLERQIATAFATVGGSDPERMSAEQDFFAWGGTSIELLKLKSSVQKLTDGLEIPKCHNLADPYAYDPIVPLNRSGSRTPIFFVHPGLGEVLVFVNLARYFQGDRPFYALRAKGFEGEPVFSSFQAMVDDQKAYALAGYSYGGVVAYEVGRRMEADGHRVGFTGRLHIPPEVAGRMQEITWTSGMLNLSYFLGLIPKRTGQALEAGMSLLPEERQLQRIFDSAPMGRVTELQLTPNKLQHWVSIAASLIECGKVYTPSGCLESSLEVFYAIPLRGSKEDWLNNQLMAWSHHALKDHIHFTDVPGEHYTLIDIDHVGRFQQIFRNRLDAAGI